MTFLSLLLACTPPAAPVSGLGADVVLPMHWTAGPVLQGETNFVLDAPAGAGTELHLDGAWWRVQLTLDGASLPAVTPGFAPLDVVLPPLGAGVHRLTASVTLPGSEPPILSLPNKNRAPRGGLFTLRLQASAALRASAVPLVTGNLRPAVVLRGAPEGATIEVAVSRDGDRLAGWGPVPAAQPLEGQRFSGDSWAIGAPALYVATTILRDAGGAILAERSERVGFRETTLVDGVFSLNGTKVPLVAVRGQPTEGPERVATQVATAGIDAVELHGAIASAAWLAPFDEWGLPLVQVPRCDGRLWQLGEEPGVAMKQYAAALAEQDSRLLGASASRPAVLAWICEGAERLRATECGGLHQDPLVRPIFGVDVPAVSIAGTYAPVATGPTWVIELGHPNGGSLPAPSVATRSFLTGVGPRGSGGVIPNPEASDGAAWGEAWSAAAKQLGAPAWRPETRRAPSVVTVKGLAPGQIVVLHAPWLAPTGAAADTTGTARIEAWYVGDATLVAHAIDHPVTLTADVWEGTKRVPKGAAVDATGW